VRITFAGSPLPKCPSFCCYVSDRDYRGRRVPLACTRLNNSVIRGTNTVSGKFKRNDDMEVLMRTYILAIATAALFAIPTAAFSEGMYFGFGPGGVRIGPSYGHHRLYNRYEGGGGCAELRQACLHKQELGEAGMGNCQRYRAMCR
jgi:hypothetical protein